ncbi:unnamed protein product [Mucor hiemalis]
MAIQTRASAKAQEAKEKDEQTEETQVEQPPPNRAARRAAQKKELKETKVAKTTKTTTRKTRTTTATRSGSASISKNLNPPTTHYEFGGVIGAAAMILLLPTLVLMFAYGCSRDSGYNPFERSYHLLTNFELSRITHELKNWSWGSSIWYLGLVVQLAVYTFALPGTEVEGERLRDGSRLKYKINALATLQTMFTISFMALRGQGYFLFLWTKAHFADIALFSVAFSFLVAIGVYIKSFIGKKMLALGGNTGNPIYDFMIGRELNPRIGSFDIKFFTELRPGLIMWLYLNVCFAINQWVEIGRVTYSMALVNIFQGWYIIDALINESSILTTMDITTDGFGFMLAFGNLCWVPMMYSLQARYLSDFPVDLSIPQVVAIVLIQCAGYFIFRSANSQKDAFRKDPNDPKVSRKYLTGKQ